jgi:hypothetical protein
MKLDDLIRDARADVPKPDWPTLDAKLFERLDREQVNITSDEPSTPLSPRRLVWTSASLTLAAAAAVLLLVHPSADATRDEQAPSALAATVSAGGVVVHGTSVKTGAHITTGDRVEVGETAFFESAGVRWTSQAGSVLRVEHAAAPLVLSLERGATEAQVTPVPSGEAFAIDMTASTGAVVRVAVHGTHLRVAKVGDEITVDLTEGVISVGAPPRRGSTLGTLVTAPAHVVIDARDVSSMNVDHGAQAVRAAELVVALRLTTAETTSQPTNHGVEHVDVQPEALNLVNRTSSPMPWKPIAPSTTAPVVDTDTWLRTADDVSSAIQACVRMAPNATFATTLTMTVGDDGVVHAQTQPAPRFFPPLPPEARDCAANVIYRRTKLTTFGDVSIPIEMKP